MVPALRTVLINAAAGVLLFASQPASAIAIELKFGGILWGEDVYDDVELTLVYNPALAQPDADSDPNVGIYSGNFAVGAAFVVNGVTRFSCGMVEGFGSAGACLAATGLNLILENREGLDYVSFGYGLDSACIPDYPCGSSLLDSVSGAELALFNVNWSVDAGVLNGDSIYQLPYGSHDQYRGSGFNIVSFRESRDALYDIWEEGPWGIASARYVPEPGSLALLGLGLAGLGLSRRRKAA